MNIFEFAMEKEKYSEDYYRQLAGKSNNKSLETVFNMLADEEAKHYKIVSDMKEDVAPDLAETTVLSDAKGVFAKMRESTQGFNFDVSQTELYRKAQRPETWLENAEFYHLDEY